jgi:hypothetical protein
MSNRRLIHAWVFKLERMLPRGHGVSTQSGHSPKGSLRVRPAERALWCTHCVQGERSLHGLAEDLPRVWATKAGWAGLDRMQSDPPQHTGGVHASTGHPKGDHAQRILSSQHMVIAQDRALVEVICGLLMGTVR